MSWFKKKIVIKEVQRNELFDFSILLLGSVFMSFAFNLFLLPNNIVIGFSGLSIIMDRLFGIRPSIFLIICNVFIMLLSFILLGKKSTEKSIIGSLLYPFFVETTSYITPYINLNNMDIIITLVCGALLTGFGSGLIYKVGYSTGGSDVLNQMLSKYLKRPIGTVTIITSSFVIASGFLAFGFQTVIYSIIVTYLMSIIIDKVMIGISESKSFYVITEYEDEVKEYLLKSLSHGLTIIPAKGGYTGNSVKIIMCIVPTKEYFMIKENILNIDHNALILVSDTYQVLGNK